jgi:Patatin-like phospholipase
MTKSGPRKRAKSNVDWEEVLSEELKIVEARRPDGQPVKDDVIGLAFSGGGIRSATFGLGVIEGLRQLNLLKKIDFLSTVSGGGYIGAWFSANCHRAAEKGRDWRDASADDWNLSVTHLRRYSNYLSPDVGFLSADTWSVLMIWLRNTILVQLTVIAAIALVLMVPRPLFWLFGAWQHVHNLRWLTVCLFVLGVVGIAGNLWTDKLKRRFKHWVPLFVGGLCCVGAALSVGIFSGFEPFQAGPVNYRLAIPVAMLLVVAGFLFQPAAVTLANKLRRGTVEVNYTQQGVQLAVVLPMMAVGLLVAAILWQQSTHDLDRFKSFGELFMNAGRYWPFPLTVVFTSLLLLSFSSISKWKDPESIIWAIVAPIPAVITLHSMFCAIVLLLQHWSQKSAEGEWLAFIWTPPFVLYSFSLTIVILIGIVGRQSIEGDREWWSRFGAWLAIYGAAWSVISVAATYGPVWIAMLLHTHPWRAISLGGGWVGTTIAGLLAGGSDKTGGKTEKSTASKALEILVSIAPFVFIAGLLVAIATVLHYIIVVNSGLTWTDALGASHTWEDLRWAEKGVTLALMGLLAGALVLLCARVDINEFSLNAFYRNRLVRCYLGATRKPAERHPQNFTGFDDHDDLKLKDLAATQGPQSGPFHIVNCALNLGGSSDLALHTRHSATFSLTPLYCGSSYMSHDLVGSDIGELGYTKTSDYGQDHGPSLGQAISVSGAAASPNMGYHTSPIVAFMLTLFNVRLGWWFPNPVGKGINSASPWFSLRYLVMELFGGADDTSRFLAISDGGHFENLAAYELVKRKCRVIIISDAECDPNLQFEGLGTLIRMCNVDFGAVISIDVGSIRPSGDSLWSGNRCAVGTIRYSDGTRGTLIYLKASMTGREDTGILQYKAAHPTFPHESTGNQFYKEDQFESYRGLGKEITLQAFAPAAGIPGLAEAAGRLEDIWSPALRHASRFTSNSGKLMELWSQMSKDSNLESLGEDLAGFCPLDRSSRFRASFYACSQMIQMMENVYLDLDLETTWEHADNQGWKATFETWVRSPSFEETWLLSSRRYGLRFRYFCNRMLGLPL